MTDARMKLLLDASVHPLNAELRFVTIRRSRMPEGAGTPHPITDPEAQRAMAEILAEIEARGR